MRRTKRLTIEEFIDRCRNVHGDKYDYSKVEYSSVNTKVEIICPIHGSFFQKPTSHIHDKSGCKECKVDAERLTTEIFIERSKKIHGDKYDYSKVDYSRTNIAVEIICPIHGSFFQTPTNHINNKRGCIRCRADAQRIDIEVFIERSVKVHGYKYDYSKVDYIDSRTTVEIICPEHGSFFQRPDGHIQGRGCSKCTIHFSSYEKIIYKLLTDLNIDFIHQDRTVIRPKELDFYIPSLDLGIEVNGYYWHRIGNGKSLYHIKDKYLRMLELNKDLVNLYDRDFMANNLKATRKQILDRINCVKEVPTTEDDTRIIISNDIGYTNLLRKNGYIVSDLETLDSIHFGKGSYIIGSGFSVVKNP